jgi:hypothetical protein
MLQWRNSQRKRKSWDYFMKMYDLQFGQNNLWREKFTKNQVSK